MTYIHEFEVSDGILIAKENNCESGKMDFILQNDNRSLKIIDFHSGCADPDYHQGTEMVLYLLNYFSGNINHIHGMLSTVDAKDDIKSFYSVEKRVGWHVSIPFYASLTKYIPNSHFHLYNDKNIYLKQDITDEYYRNPDACIERLIVANQDCSFSINIDANSSAV